MKTILNITLASVGILTQYNYILFACIILIGLINVNNFVNKFNKNK